MAKQNITFEIIHPTIMNEIQAGKLNSNIKIVTDKIKYHTKASEEFIVTEFTYPNSTIDKEVWIPIKYRRTGIEFNVHNEENSENIVKLITYINRVYQEMNPTYYSSWLKDQDEYWATSRALVTKSIFDILKDGKWHCVCCDIKNTNNFARRIQDIKERGYTISTQINYLCPKCKSNRATRLRLLPISRVELSGNGYETWSKTLRERIIKILDGKDVYENCSTKHCLPDHKFPEIRWDNNTKEQNLDIMTEEEIKAKFQLLTNQRNLQKREVCRKCFQKGERGVLFGIPFFYKGTDKWDESIPKKGKVAEQGCEGCGWYDINKWRQELIKSLNK